MSEPDIQEESTTTPLPASAPTSIPATTTEPTTTPPTTTPEPTTIPATTTPELTTISPTTTEPTTIPATTTLVPTTNLPTTTPQPTTIPPTTTPAAAATNPVLLGVAGDFVILSKTGISTVPVSAITGDIGVSPIAATAITGFDLVLDASNTFSLSPQVTGQCFAADYASPTPSMLTTAISDMETAYTDAAGRPLTDGANLNIASGLISGTTFTEGVYKWGSDINFASDIYLSGDSNSIFIFQTTGNVIVGSGAKVTLLYDGSGGTSGSGPSPANIFWQVAGYVDVGTTSQLKGIFLVKTHAAFKAGSSLDGRILAQTACTLISATITDPLLLCGQTPIEKQSLGGTHTPASA